MERKALFSRKTSLLLGLMLTLFLMANTSTVTVHALGFDDQTFFADPYWINGTQVGVGNTATVNINISNAYKLWAWQTALKFDPAILGCVSVAEGEFMKRQGLTLWIPGAIDNVTGKVAYSAVTATIENVTGSGQLMTATFQVKALGISDIHIMNAKTNTDFGAGNITATASRVCDKYTVLYGGAPYVVTIYHNATGVTTPPATPTGIPALALDTVNKNILFNMTFKAWSGTPSSTAYCNVTIPKNLLWLQNASDNWVIVVGGSLPDYNATTSDASYNYVYFTTTYTAQATKNAVITGTGVVPELQPMLALLLVTVGLAASMLLAKRKLHRSKAQLQTQILKKL